MNDINLYALDIETIPDPDILATMVKEIPTVDSMTFEAPKSYKDEEKIAEHIAGQRVKAEETYQAEVEKARKRCSLDPWLGRIASIALSDEDGESGLTLGHVKKGKKLPTWKVVEKSLDEREGLLLQWIWDQLKRCHGVITYNGLHFDMRWLRIRSLVHGIRPTFPCTMPRYRPWPICDLMEHLAGWSPQDRVKLDLVCRSLGIRSPKEDGVDGSKVFGLALAGEWDKILHYNERDTLATWEVFQYLVEYRDLSDPTPGDRYGTSAEGGR